MFLSACVLAMLPGAGPALSATALAPTADGKLLFVAMNSGGEVKADTGFVCVWDLTKPELRAVVPQVPGVVRAIRPTADGKRFVVISGDRWTVSRIAVFDTMTKKLLHTFDGAAKYGSQATISPDGNWAAFRPTAEKPELKVWNTDTGKRVEAIEKAAGDLAGTVAFTAESKLAVATTQEYAEFDPATGKKTGGWKQAEPTGRIYRELAGHVAVLPNGKGLVSVAATGKRRQSYVIQIITEKKAWFLGEAWYFASAPTVSPDGRLLIVSAGSLRSEGGTFALKLDADGAPELTDPKDDAKIPFWGGGRDEKVPAWREWSFGEAKGGGRALPERELHDHMTFAPDGKRIFVGGTPGRLQVYDTERRTPLATLFAARPTKDEVPEWHILTAAGEVVGSPEEVETLVKAGKVKDAAKVKEALGVK